MTKCRWASKAFMSKLTSLRYTPEHQDPSPCLCLPIRCSPSDGMLSPMLPRPATIGKCLRRGVFTIRIVHRKTARRGVGSRLLDKRIVVLVDQSQNAMQWFSVSLRPVGVRGSGWVPPRCILPVAPRLVTAPGTKPLWGSVKACFKMISVRK